MFIGICKGCGKIIENNDPSVNLYKKLKKPEDYAELFSRSPHYFCSECIKEMIREDKK